MKSGDVLHLLDAGAEWIISKLVDDMKLGGAVDSLERRDLAERSGYIDTLGNQQWHEI